MNTIIEKLGREVTTICTGGPVKIFHIDTLHGVKEFLDEHKSFYTLGFGSNTLIPDEGLATPFLQLGDEFKKIEIYSDSVYIGAGVALMSAARKLSGIVPLEFAGGIPASVGGAVVMNAGAHKSDMSSVIREIHLVLPNGDAEIITHPKCEYRKTHIPSGSIVTGVVVQRSDQDIAVSQQRLEENLSYRKRTQPLTLPSFGSVFKNPSSDISAGLLIERAGLKGTVIGDVMISSMHANWIVNPQKKGRTGDALRLIELCKERVLRSEGIELHEEVVIAS